MNINNDLKDFGETAIFELNQTNPNELKTDISTLKNYISKNNDIVLYGPPGTGKTWLINKFISENSDMIADYETVQFHSSFSYEDFIEGISPNEDAEAKAPFKITKGVFYSFCKKAEKGLQNGKKGIYLFIIDELNRADVTSVFGELLNLMDDKGQRKLVTPKSKQLFSIPENVVIAATMNTSDKSLRKLDFAFRRRFKFLPMYPNSETLFSLVSASGFDNSLEITVQDYCRCFKLINHRIRSHPLMGKDLMLGHTLWITNSNYKNEYSRAEIANIFRDTIFPQLESYSNSDLLLLEYLLNKDLARKITQGYHIDDLEIIGFIKSISNSKETNVNN